MMQPVSRKKVRVWAGPVSLVALVALTGCQATSIELFNGRDFTGWTYHLSDPNVGMDEVWSVEDGVLKCTGNPPGYLRTVEEGYHDYVLELEWRWPGEGGNNGVLVHTTTPGALGVWPRSIEVQLQSGNAGDFWIIGTELNVVNEQERPSGRRYRKLVDGLEKTARPMEPHPDHLPRRRDLRGGQRPTRQSRHELQRDARRDRPPVGRHADRIPQHPPAAAGVKSAPLPATA